MTTAGSSAGRPGRPRERVVVASLCAFAALRVAVYAAAFPFFGTVDERFHLDVVIRYAHLDVPNAIAAPVPETISYLIYFGSPEYLTKPEARAEGVRVPPWTQRPEAVAELMRSRRGYWTDVGKSTEASQPPLYYLIAGAWWRLVHAFGADGLAALYALRLLNAAFVAALVALSWAVARVVAPEDGFVRLAVPAIAAVLPQSIFFVINNDVLSPLAFGLAFLLLMRFLTAPAPTAAAGASLGLALAAALLTKVANLPLVLVAAGAVAFAAVRRGRSGRHRIAAPALASLAACAIVPAASWAAWFRLRFGDWTGSSAKIAILRWTAKPVSQWLPHPIVTPAGAWFFLRGNLASFWQGEEVWFHERMAFPAADLAYTLGTLALLGVAAALLLRRRPPLAPPHRLALATGFALVASSFAFLAFLSVKFDFHDCVYPSRAAPFFVSGRLMLGLLVPFLVIVATGLGRVLAPLGARGRFVALAVGLVGVVAVEMATSAPVFHSAYNWLHS